MSDSEFDTLSDDPPMPQQPDPTNAPRPRNWPLIILSLGAVFSAPVTLLLGYAIRKADPAAAVPPAQVIYVPVASQAVAAGAEAGNVAPSFGWHADADQVAENLDPAKTPQFDATPAGKAAMGDEDVYLWQAVRRVNNRGPPWYPNVNQQSVGCCVGCGWKHAADVCQASQIINGQRAAWKPLSVEVVYGLSRIDVGKGQLRGDGSLGAWAKAASEQYGMAPMQKYGSADLTVFSPARARQFGAAGVPADIKAAAKEHPIKGCALVKSWADVKRAVQQNYPVAVCSNVGFDNPDGSVGTRDHDGFCAARGVWPHCMCVIGVRGGKRPGGFVLNSWGDSAHGGPVWPEDAPPAGFWADADVIDRMARQGDSFALSELVGFPARKLNWD